MKYSLTRATPRNMRYALCDSCGFRFHIKDLIKVTNKWNRKYGLLLCKRDFESSQPNPQDRPKVVKEVLVQNINKMRPEGETRYITNPNDDRVPGKPLEGAVYTDALDGAITLRWSAPLDQGSSPIQYYIIEYSIPQRFNYIVLTSNSGTNVPYYKDTTNSPSSEVSYKVAAVNGFGQGEFSDEFYWPTDVYADILLHGEQYWVTGDLDLIVTGSSEPIIVLGLTP